ncbi:hypothetical protein Ddye_025696 [Dipteronia dyeriana]|uniref:Zinc finger PMZ-type domain-containing protein n=1 Tax=Dipteronia dyeriana TaxID=168575 RepID=A0AAD9TKW1_9ROSI|nr:hypothetical protein Ddye_025696 [Dipteronia dyeriana]
MSECFNNWIKEDRDKPILTLIESLRRMMMLRFHEKCEEIEKLQDSVYSYARERLNENEKEGRKLQVIHGMREYYETLDNFSNKVIVNLNEKTCDCKMWEISGIPYKHATVVFCFNRQFVHESVDWYYSKEAFKLTYSGCINPVPEERPEFAEEEIIEPPKKHPKVGRLKKNRRREPDEEPARAKFSRRCTNCHHLGHNSRTCSKAAAKV